MSKLLIITISMSLFITSGCSRKEPPTIDSNDTVMSENQRPDILIDDSITDLDLQPRDVQDYEPVEYDIDGIFNNRFSFENSIEYLNGIRNMLAGFTALTDEARKVIPKDKLNEIGNTSAEMQMLGFFNIPNSVEGTLRKQEYMIKKLRYELAGYKLKSGEISHELFEKIEKEYQDEKASLQKFWNEFQIAD